MKTTTAATRGQPEVHFAHLVNDSQEQRDLTLGTLTATMAAHTALR